MKGFVRTIQRFIDARLQVGGADVADDNPVPTGTAQFDISQTPTISAAGIYAAGDALGGKLTFANAALASGGSGMITKVRIVDDDQELAPVELVLFNQDFTATNDNAPFDPSDADMQNCLGFIDVAQTDYASFVDNSVAAKTSGLRMPFPYQLGSGGSTMYGQLVVRGTPTYTATDDITVIITVERYS